MGYWKTVASRTIPLAAKAVGMETREKVVMVFVIQGLIAAAIYIGLGQTPLDAGSIPRILAALAPFALFPVLYVLKFFTVPPLIAKEADARYEELVTKTSGEVERLNTALKAAANEIQQLRKPPAPPERDANGIYQFGKMVGTAQGPYFQESAGQVHFDALEVGGSFNRAAEFEYREFSLRIASFRAEMFGMFGNVRAGGTMGGVLCEIISRQPTA